MYQGKNGDKGVLSLEVINPQPNDWYVKELIECFTEIRNAFKGGGYRANSSFLKEKTNTNLLERIEKATKKRLGFKIFIRMPNNYQNCSIFTITAPNYNIHDESASDYYNDLKNEIENNKDKYKNTDYMSFYNSYKAFDKALNSTGVIIDNVKSHISNLPDDFSLLVQLDVYFFMLELDCTPEEMTGIFLHEMGHGYTAIELSYRSIKNTSCILDAINDLAIKQKKSVKEAILYAYKTDLNMDVSTLKDKNLAMVVYAGINEIFKGTTGFSMSRRAYSDIEAVADQFAARFGVSEYLSSGLKKFDDKFKVEKILSINESYQSSVYMVAVVGLLIVSIHELIIGITTASIILGNVLIAPLYLIFFVVINIVGILLFDDDAYINTYDRLNQRMARLRNDIVRQIRLYDVDTATAKVLLKQYDYIIKVMSTIPKEEPTIKDKIHRFFLTDLKNRADAKVFEEIVEDLMENSLHISAARFKTIELKK